MGFGGFPTPGPAPIARPGPAPKPIARPGPAPLPPKMVQPPRPPAPKPPPMVSPMPTPKLPYGGPIAMPGQPLPPGVSIGGGPAPLPGQPGFGPAPIQGMPTPGVPGGKSTMPGTQPPGFQTTWQQAGYNSLEEMKAATDPNMGNAQIGFGNPMPPSMYTQPAPNFATAMGTSSPFLNSVQR